MAKKKLEIRKDNQSVKVTKEQKFSPKAVKRKKLSQNKKSDLQTKIEKVRKISKSGNTLNKPLDRSKPIDKNKYKIVLWTDFETAYKKIEKGEYKHPIYDLCDEETIKMRAYLVSYFLENRNDLYKISGITGIKNFPFNGSYHQNADDGVPVIKFKNKLYSYTVTMRRWGDLMAEVWSTINRKKYLSIDEFWKEENRDKKIGENTYCYLDFWLSWDKV